jgi:hypothetical protein
LYLLISADKKEAVEKAEAKIREIMSRGSERVGNTTLVSLSLFLSLSSLSYSLQSFQYPSSVLLCSNVLIIGLRQAQVTTKVFVGLDNVEPSFVLISRLLGKQGTNVKYIATESGAKITLKGRGTEHTSTYT